MKQQNLNNELILTFDDIKDTRLPWKREINQLLEIIEKVKKNKVLLKEKA